jgi:predicted HD phosphohydrolase
MWRPSVIWWARDQEYAARLSEASIVTLGHQGGPMSELETREFETLPGYSDMLRLRVWDDRAKEPGRGAPSLESYRDMMIRHLRGVVA